MAGWMMMRARDLTPRHLLHTELGQLVALESVEVDRDRTHLLGLSSDRHAFAHTVPSDAEVTARRR